MKIGFDAKRAAQNATGLGNYSRFVIGTLASQWPQHQYHLYVPSPRRATHLAQLPQLDSMHVHYPQGSLWSRLPSAWRTWGMASSMGSHGIDLFHGLSGELPLGLAHARCRSVVTIHDLIFLHSPQYYKAIDRAIYHAKSRSACHRASRIVAVSEFTKREIVRYYGIDEGKIDVVYQGCDPAFGAPISQQLLDETRQKYALPPQYVLYVGSIERRKNLMLVARALCLMASRGISGDSLPHVVAVGKHTPYATEVMATLREAGLESHLTMLHGVGFAHLPAIYRMATLFVYPSRIEGFGIPLLEAAMSGLPSIGCTGSCLEEAAGPGALYVGPDDVGDMADAMAQLMGSATQRGQMAAMGREYAERFAPNKLADSLMQAYLRALQ